MRISIKNSIINWFLQCIQVQLWVTLFSLPLLVSWGLPLSGMTIVGNLIFVPYITLFLLCSSIIFFTELIYIPNTWLIAILEYITWSWSWIISWGNTSWLIELPKPPFFILFALPLAAIACMQLRMMRSLHRRVLLLIDLLTCFILLTVYLPKRQGHWHVPCGKYNVDIVRAHKTTYVIDKGYIARVGSPRSWVEYTLIPSLIKNVGTSNIDAYICLEPSTRAFKALRTCCERTHIHTAYISAWSGKAHKSMLHAYYTMKNSLEEQGTTMVRIPDHHEKFIVPLNTIIRSGRITYPAICIRIFTGKETIEISPAHYKR